MPFEVSAYLVIEAIRVAVVLAISDWSKYVTARVVANVLFALLIAAVVVWRQRWALFLSLLIAFVAFVSPAWGEWPGPVLYVANLVSLALLVSPGMRRWVGVGRRRHPPAAMPTEP